MSLPLLRALKWGTVWTFISRGIRNTKSQTFGFPDLLNKICLFCNFGQLAVWIQWSKVTHLNLSFMVKTYLIVKGINAFLHYKNSFKRYIFSLINRLLCHFMWFLQYIKQGFCQFWYSILWNFRIYLWSWCRL